MTATITPFPARTPDPATDAALANLIQFGTTIARVASRLAEVEDRTLDALAVAAERATQAVLAAQPTLSDALQAGRNADTSDAARDAVAARLASVAQTFDKTARAVRRTAALQARLASGRPFRAAPPDPAPAARAHRGPTARHAPANDADRPDQPEWGDEIDGETDETVLRTVRRDLAEASATLAASSAQVPARPAPGHPASRAPGPIPGLTPAPVPIRTAPLPLPDT